MKLKNKFIDELIELLYKYDLPVEDFLNLVNDDKTWVQKVSRKYFNKLRDWNGNKKSNRSNI